MTPPPALVLRQEIYRYGFRFSPTPQEAVKYYLPRLTAGEPLHEAVRFIIHHADVYACAPADLARRFRPMPKTDDRFFFTPCKNDNKAVRAAGSTGYWAAQTTAEIKEKDVKVGELRKLRYKKHGVLTDWLMDEYSSSSSSSCGDNGDKQQQLFVFCKVYVSPRAAPSSDARHESAAFLAQPPPARPAAAVVAQPAAKRTAPQAAMPPCAKRAAPLPPRDAMPPCAKRMRGPVLRPPPPAPIRSPLTAVRKVCFAPPQPCALLRTGSPAPQPPAPPAPTRSPVAAVRKLYFAPPQPCAPLRTGSPAPSVTQTQPSPAPIQAPAPPVLTRPMVEPRCSPMPPPPLGRSMQQVPLPTPPVVRASCHMPRQAMAPGPCRPQVSVLPKQRRILDPFEAAMLRQQAEEQTVAAAPDPPLSKQFPAPAPALQDDDDDDDDDFVKDLEDAMSADEAEEQTVAAALQDDEDDWDDLAKELEF